MTAAMTAAMTMVLTVAQSTPGEAVMSRSVLLTSSSYQLITDQIIATEKQIAATNSGYSFITQSDLASLPAYTRALAASGLSASFSQLALTNHYDPNMAYQAFPWNAPSTEPLQFLNDPNADNKYIVASIDSRAYTITIHPEAGTKDVTFVPMSGTGLNGNFLSTGFSYDLSQFTPNADGSYTITMSPNQQPGNWVNSTGAQTLLLRDTVGNWGLLHDSITLQQQGEPSTFTLPVLSKSQISSILNNIATNLSGLNSSVTNFGIQKMFASIPDNTFKPIAPTTSAVGGPILPGQLSSLGRYNLQPDQALIVKVPDVAAGYTGAQLSNAWQLDLPYATATGSINSSDVFKSSDGYTYYVVSAQNPGVANWLNTGGTTDGSISLRFQNLAGNPSNTQVTAVVVPIADVLKNLPADTPAVTPAQYAAKLKERLFEYNYFRDQNNTAVGWVTGNLENDQIKAAIGTSTYNEIFGSQPNVPSVLDRVLNPALTPDYLSLVRTVLADPSRSLSAIVRNLPLAAQDIMAPAVLAVLRLGMLVGNTTASVLHELTAGQLVGALQAVGAGIQGLGTLANQTFVDPATSITAGFLNARDDLSVAIANSKSYSPLSLGTIQTAMGQLGQVNQSAANMLFGGLAGVVQLLSPANIAGAAETPAAAAKPPATAAKSAVVPAANTTTTPASAPASASTAPVAPAAAPATTGAPTAPATPVTEAGAKPAAVKTETAPVAATPATSPTTATDAGSTGSTSTTGQHSTETKGAGSTSASGQHSTETKGAGSGGGSSVKGAGSSSAGGHSAESKGAGSSGGGTSTKGAGSSSAGGQHSTESKGAGSSGGGSAVKGAGSSGGGSSASAKQSSDSK
ncbi:hypothetical protein [Mycolicibacterium sp. HS_4_1]